MQKLLYMCLLFSLHGTLYAPLFFWKNQESNVFGLHYDLYDICIDGGGCTGYNHTDVPLFIKYIHETLLPNQNEAVTFVLKRLLFLLDCHCVSVPYQNDFVGPVNQIKPIEGTAPAATSSAPKPLSTEQKKEKILQMLSALGYARPFEAPVNFKGN